MHKIETFRGTADTMAAHGFPYASVLAAAATALELGSKLMLIVGFRARCADVFHPFWTMGGGQYRQQMSSFYQHLGIMGGMLYVTVFGAGKLSVGGGRD